MWDRTLGSRRAVFHDAKSGPVTQNTSKQTKISFRVASYESCIVSMLFAHTNKQTCVTLESRIILLRSIGVCNAQVTSLFSQNIGITLIGRFTLVGYDDVWLVAATTNNFHIHICSLEIYKSAHVGSRCHIRSGLCWVYFVAACHYLPQGWPQQLQHVGDVDAKLNACVFAVFLAIF